MLGREAPDRELPWDSSQKAFRVEDVRGLIAAFAPEMERQHPDMPKIQARRSDPATDYANANPAPRAVVISAESLDGT